jgi:hypothetical protein
MYLESLKRVGLTIVLPTSEVPNSALADICISPHALGEEVRKEKL